MQRKGTADVSAICLLTDGMMNQGETNCDILVSMTKKLVQNFEKKTKPSIFTFGYGSDADSKVLSALAEATGGSFYAIANAESVPLSFADALGGLQSTAAQNIEMVVELSGGGAEFSTEAVITKFPVERLSSSIYKVNIKDMYVGEGRDLLFKIRIPKAPTSSLPSPTTIRVSLKYMDTINVKLSSIVSESMITRVKGNVLNDENTGDDVVGKHQLRLEAAKAMQDAQKLAEAGKYEEAKTSVDRFDESVAFKMKSKGWNDDLMLCEVARDLKISSEGLKSKEEFKKVGQAYMQSASVSHQYQRSNKVDGMIGEGKVEANAYANMSKKKMMGMAKSAFGYE